MRSSGRFWLGESPYQRLSSSFAHPAPWRVNASLCPCSPIRPEFFSIAAQACREPPTCARCTLDALVVCRVHGGALNVGTSTRAPTRRFASGRIPFAMRPASPPGGSGKGRSLFVLNLLRARIFLEDGRAVEAEELALGKNSLMALRFSPNCERWQSSKMKTMRLCCSGSNCSL